MPTPRPLIPFVILLIALAIFAAALVVVAALPFGAGLSPDSVSYIATARSLLNGLGVWTINGALVDHPPLYPLVLAGGAALTGVDPLAAAAPLNALLFGGMVALAGVLLLGALRRPLVALLGAGMIALFSPLLSLAVMAWSEPLFIALTLLFFVLFGQYTRAPHWGWLIALGLVAALACLTRYIGVTLVLAGAASVLLYHGRRRDRLSVIMGREIVFVGAALLPFGAWLMRNWAVSGTLFGERVPTVFTFADSVSATIVTASEWLLLDRLPVALTLIALTVALVGVLYAAVRRWDALRSAAIPIVPMLIFVVVYTSFLIVSASTTAFDQINSRLLSPAAIPLMIAGLVLAAALLRLVPSRGVSRALLVVMIGGIAAWSGVHTYRSAALVDDMRERGRGFSGVTWRQHPLIAVLRESPLLSDCPVYSNEPWAIYALLGLPADHAPAHTYYLSTQPHTALAALEGAFPPEGRACLVWFGARWSHLYTLDELRTVIQIETLLEQPDGSGVYRLTRLLP